MSIKFNENNNVFILSTKNTSYIMGLLKGKHLLHLYYGKKLSSFPNNVESMIPSRLSASGSASGIEGGFSSDLLPTEYPTYGSTDLRTPAFHAVYEDGSATTNLEYISHTIYDGKKELSGLPSTYCESGDDVTSLEIKLGDKRTRLEVMLIYSVYEKYDAIVRSVNFINDGYGTINIKSALSQCAYMFDKDFDIVHLSGGYGTERLINKTKVSHGIFTVDSKRMSSSHHHSPFIALARPNVSETEGEVYGFSLIYSGDFIAGAEMDTYDNIRINMGINPFGFNWKLEPGDTFQIPELVSIYSENGFGHMSRCYHKLYRKRLCRGKFRDTHRPILLNSWEACYYDFNEEKIINLAKKAKQAGIEMLVLDDGWFGKRDDDTTSLGDWYVNRKKIPSGLGGLADRINSIGLKFGIWMEPEMISPQSELYKEHPDWCIAERGRESSLYRNQLILDLSRTEVQDFIINSVSSVLSLGNISYLKWDMNRNVSEKGSQNLPVDRQQELSHRYYLGLYRVLDVISKQFPNVLFEGCAAGGGRYDPGMLYYFPQYWTSDNSDAISRLYIQYGTSLVMPSSTMVTHVSSSPNKQNGRITPMDTRANVAMTGQLGYELNLLELSDDEILQIRTQIDAYKKYRDTVCFGDMYRLKSPFESDCSSVSFVKDDKSSVFVMICNSFVMKHLSPMLNIKLQGLDPKGVYVSDDGTMAYTGEFLMNRGLYFADRRDYKSEILYFEKQ